MVLGRHRVLTALGILLLALAGLLAYRWAGSAAHPVSAATALERFRAQSSSARSGLGGSVPGPGVYAYEGGATEKVSLPPKTQNEGPKLPGTVVSNGKGCWSIRIDFSDSHWESSSYCSRPQGLVLTGRGGWMRWDFVVITVSDTSTYSCDPAEMVLPAGTSALGPASFSCRGGNRGISTGPVTMSGTTRFIGIESVSVGGTRISAAHVREKAVFSGGQTGSNVVDTWYGPNGLPVRVTWSQTVHTPSPLGNATMTASGHYQLASLQPRT